MSSTTSPMTDGAAAVAASAVAASSAAAPTKAGGGGKPSPIPPETVEYLRAWMMSPEHVDHPYPTKEEKARIMAETGIGPGQLSTWFVNNRIRYWKPRVGGRAKSQSLVQGGKRESNDAGPLDTKTKGSSEEMAPAFQSGVNQGLGEYDPANAHDGAHAPFAPVPALPAPAPAAPKPAPTAPVDFSLLLLAAAGEDARMAEEHMERRQQMRMGEEDSSAATTKTPQPPAPPPESKCKVAGCDKWKGPLLRHGGYCARHFKERCRVEGCDKLKRASHGYCQRHYNTFCNEDERVDKVCPEISPKDVVEEDVVPNASRRCKVDGCNKYKRPNLDGFCASHFKELDAALKAPSSGKYCKVEGCGKWKRASHGFCSSHYRIFCNNEEQHADEVRPETSPEDDVEEDDVEEDDVLVYNASKRCKRDGCNKYKRARCGGFCKGCYEAHDPEECCELEGCEEQKVSETGYCRRHAVLASRLSASTLQTTKQPPSSSLKPHFKQKTAVYAGYWPPEDTHRESYPSWYPGIVSSSRVSAEPADESYGYVRYYDVHFDDGDKLDRIPDHFVMAAEEYSLHLRHDSANQGLENFSWKGVRNVTDTTSNDSWAKYVGWHVANIDGEEHTFSLLGDALRAYDAAVVHRKGVATKRSDLNLPEEWSELFERDGGKINAKRKAVPSEPSSVLAAAKRHKLVDSGGANQRSANKRMSNSEHMKRVVPEMPAVAVRTKSGRAQMCGECEACLREDCGECEECRDKAKYGGPNKRRQKCLMRRCANMFLPAKSSASAKPATGRERVDRSDDAQPMTAEQRRQRISDSISRRRQLLSNVQEMRSAAQKRLANRTTEDGCGEVPTGKDEVKEFQSLTELAEIAQLSSEPGGGLIDHKMVVEPNRHMPEVVQNPTNPTAEKLMQTKTIAKSCEDLVGKTENSHHVDTEASGGNDAAGDDHGKDENAKSKNQMMRTKPVHERENLQLDTFATDGDDANKMQEDTEPQKQMQLKTVAKSCDDLVGKTEDPQLDAVGTDGGDAASDGDVNEDLVDAESQKQMQLKTDAKSSDNPAETDGDNLGDDDGECLTSHSSSSGVHPRCPDVSAEERTGTSSPTTVCNPEATQELETKQSSSHKLKHKKVSTLVMQQPHGRRAMSCGQCEGCRREDCGQCEQCRDKRKFGGPNKLKQKCARRRCANVILAKDRAQQGRSTTQRESASPAMASSAPSAPSADASVSKRNKGGPEKESEVSTPLFAFETVIPTVSGERPKRRLKAITRFDPLAQPNAISCKVGEGFQCPQCNMVCSYDSRMCEDCGLECYYEAGVGVVTAVSQDATTESRIFCAPVAYARKAMMCGQCEGCRREDCGKCRECLDKKKYGGPNRLKQKCAKRRCENMNLAKGSTQQGLSSAPRESASPVTAASEPSADASASNRSKDNSEKESGDSTPESTQQGLSSAPRESASPVTADSEPSADASASTRSKDGSEEESGHSTPKSTQQGLSSAPRESASPATADSEPSADASASNRSKDGSEEESGDSTLESTQQGLPSPTAESASPAMAASEPSADASASNGSKDGSEEESEDSTPLFAFETVSLTNSGERPKRRLKAITRFDPLAQPSASNCKIGEGFQCPECNMVCSYDSRSCEDCGLECYYEAGVGVVVVIPEDGNTEQNRGSLAPQQPLRAIMCGQCEGCLHEDCGECRECLDKPKFGGKNKRKQKCAKRRCANMNLAKERTHRARSPTHRESPSPIPTSPSNQASTSKRHKGGTWKNSGDTVSLFAFEEPSSNVSGGRPKRKLKAITRFDPQAQPNTSTSNCKVGEGFSCPRCSTVCSYDSRRCEDCGLECYYEAGMGVVTLKERM